MKVNSTLKKYVKNMSGSLIGIGIQDVKIVEEIDKSNKILMCDLLNCVDLDDDSVVSKKRAKKVYVKKLRKRYKKKRIDYMIINSEEIKPFLKTFIRDTIYINKNEIYYFSEKKDILEKIKKKYHRYTKKTEITKYEDGYILKIDTDGTKNKFLKDKLYYLIDTISNIEDLIADILIG